MSIEDAPARIAVQLDFDLPGIAAAAGQPDPGRFYYDAGEGELVVFGVAQEALAAALAAQDWVAVALDRSRAAALDRIDEAAGAARAAFVAPGAYQDEEYRQAAVQADACAAGDPGPFPALEADVDAGTVDPRLGRAVATVEEAADLIRWTRDRWLQALDQIRTIRLIAKAQVRAATSGAEISDVLAGLTFPTPG